MQHISEISYEKGHTFNGYRVNIQRKGVIFCEYVSAKGDNWEVAKEKAIKLRDKLMESLSKCHNQDEVINFYIKWKKQK